MKILVIGGAGYIGSHQVKMLCDLDHEVFVLDNLSTGHEKFIDKRSKFYKGDIKDYALLKKIMENKIDGIIHFAAYSIVSESNINPLKYFDNNVYGMQVLLQAMNDFNVKNIVFSSTAAIFGNSNEVPITEDAPKNPINSYGESKLMMEKMMKWCDSAYGIKFIALRYFNAAGANELGHIGEIHKPETHLIPIIIEAALNKREYVTIFGNDYNTFDGTCIRDYIHVDDLCNAHILSLEKLIDGCKSDYFNLGSGNGYSILEVIKAVEKVSNKKINYKIGEKRIGDPAILIASNKKAINTLNWKIKYNNIEDIISSAYNFYLRNDTND